MNSSAQATGRTGSYVRGKNARGFDAQNRPDTLSSRLHAVTHGAVDGGRLHVFAGHQPFERGIDRGSVFFEKCGETHRLAGLARARLAAQPG